MIRLIRLIKWGLTLISIVWAVYSADFFFFLARTFPEPDKGGVAELFASIQGYAIVFGPILIALFFLTSRWPERKIRILSALASDKKTQR